MFIGLDNLTGLGTFSLAIPNLPAFTHVTFALFLWAIAFGFASAVLGWLIRVLGLLVRPVVERRSLLYTPVVGAAIAVAGGIVFAEITGHNGQEVLFSGQDALAGLVDNPGDWTVGALVVLLICKSIAYGLIAEQLPRRAETFPAMFVGAAMGMAVANLPGLSLVPAVGHGAGGTRAPPCSSYR